MRKSWVLFTISLQDAFSERGSAIVWAFLDFLWPFVNLFIWVGIYQGQGGAEVTIGGFSLSQMLTYYLGVALISAVAVSHQEYEIIRDIQSGDLSTYLLKPLSYVKFQLITSISWKILKGSIIFPFILIAIILFKDHISFNLNPTTALVFIGVLVLSFLLYFLNALIFGLLTFWVDEPGGFIEMNEIARSLFSGMALPLVFLPGPFFVISNILPYKYFYDFPLRILSGKLGTTEILNGLLMQFVWIFIFYTTYKVMWRRGISKYSAFGG